MANNNIVLSNELLIGNMSNSSNTVVEEKFMLSSDKVKFISLKYSTGEHEAYAKTSPGYSIIDGMQNVYKDLNDMIEMLIRAVNNRTIERNYFKLNCDLLSGNISEEDFNKTIDNNIDDYVIDSDIVPNINELEKALLLAKDIKDVENSEDLSSLFSYNSIEIDKLLPKLSND